MSRDVTFILPGPIARTGGYIYDRRMIDGLRALGWLADSIVIDGSFPFPDATTRGTTERIFACLPDRRLVIVDGLALGAIPEIVESHARRLRIVGLVHLPLGADPTRDAETSAQLAAADGRALRAAALVIVTSRATLPMLDAYGLTNDRVVVIEPGTDAVPSARGSGQSGSIELLCVATVNAGKGHATLLEALAALRDRRWHLTCAGSLTRDPATAHLLQRMVADLKLHDRVSLVGELDELPLAAAYDAADIFVLATLRETYGMAVAEALAHGLPIVSTTTGAIPPLVGEEAGLLVPPGDVDALGRALAAVLDDRTLRDRLRDGARRAGARLPTWTQAAERMSATLEGLVSHG